ncbi:MAG: hypothetical protein ACPHLK_04095, partial [Gammaproteobacteria bacterium]
MTLDTDNDDSNNHPGNLSGNHAGTKSLSSKLSIDLDDAIQAAKNKLIEQQHEDGHWVYELEADCTIPAEYILMNHFVDEV